MLSELGASPTLHVLLIESDAAEADRMQAACRALPLPVTLHLAPDGEAALTLLRNDVRISLVLLDQQLLGEDGLRWLREFKAHADLALRRLPVIMLSSSDTEEQIRRAYYAYASAYLIRPPDAEGLRRMLESLVTYWGQVARLPARP